MDMIFPGVLCAYEGHMAADLPYIRGNLGAAGFARVKGEWIGCLLDELLASRPTVDIKAQRKERNCS